MRWVPIPGWEGFYEINDVGDVRSIERTLVLADGRVRTFPGCPRRTYLDGFGYRKVTLNRHSVHTRIHVHHLVALAFIGPRPAGMHVCHNDGDHLNNAPTNLRYDTARSNVADTKRHGRLNPRRKLSEETVAAIRAARGTATGAELAERYGTSKAHVCNIQRGNRRPL